MIDVTKFIGQVHQVAEQNTGRKVTIEITDAGPSPLPDKRPMIALTCALLDGKRADVRTAEWAAEQLLDELLPGFTPGWLAEDNGMTKVARQREKGAGNGGTRFTFVVTCGWRKREEAAAPDYSRLPLDEVIKAINADYAARFAARPEIAEVEARFAAAMAQYAAS